MFFDKNIIACIVLLVKFASLAHTQTLCDQKQNWISHRQGEHVFMELNQPATRWACVYGIKSASDKVACMYENKCFLSQFCYSTGLLDTVSISYLVNPTIIKFSTFVICDNQHHIIVKTSVPMNQQTEYFGAVALMKYQPISMHVI